MQSSFQHWILFLSIQLFHKKEKKKNFFLKLVIKCSKIRSKLKQTRRELLKFHLRKINLSSFVHFSPIFTDIKNSKNQWIMRLHGTHITFSSDKSELWFRILEQLSTWRSTIYKYLHRCLHLHVHLNPRNSISSDKYHP